MTADAKSLIVAEKLGLDPDAEGIAVVDCGGKGGIELVVRVCRAMDIPFAVLHDEDVWRVEDIADEDKRKKQEKDNRDETQKNQRIRNAIGSGAGLFVLRPSLEAVLGIARDARDKPRRIADALEGVDLEQPPATLNALLDAVKAAMQDTNSRG